MKINNQNSLLSFPLSGRLFSSVCCCFSSKPPSEKGITTFMGIALFFLRLVASESKRSHFYFLLNVAFDQDSWSRLAGGCTQLVKSG